MIDISCNINIKNLTVPDFKIQIDIFPACREVTEEFGIRMLFGSVFTQIIQIRLSIRFYYIFF